MESLPRIRQKSAIWEQALAGGVVLGLAVLAGFGIQRMSVYWSEDQSEYYNPNYAKGDDINNVIIHSTLGFVSFLCVPLWIATSWVAPGSFWLKAVTAFTVLALIATFVTVPLISDTIIGSQSGTAVVITAVVWAIWWVVCCILSAVAHCRGANEGRLSAWAWWVRFMGMSVFGFVLIPIFYALRNSKAGSAVALIALLAVVVLLSEWLVWRSSGSTVEEDAVTADPEAASIELAATVHPTNDADDPPRA
eukprot:TRINITY_DN9119_c0_g2_i1.p1 TRINITY_DN9119_c0_g2~~TRINITY_DN9119_c0_g2_i1.p1  ORF type:complete len:250 (+),score=38.08 TRINITY_DN9119_c0_g2_i1:163-912(+)